MDILSYVEIGKWVAGSVTGVAGTILLFYKVRREIPFVRVTETQQLEAARWFLDQRDGAEALHEYTKGLASRTLVKSPWVTAHEVEFLLRLPDPYEHVSRYAALRPFFEPFAGAGCSGMRFVERYSSRRLRAFQKGGATFLYFLFAALAFSPLLLLHVHRLVPVVDGVPALNFASNATDVLIMFAFTLVFFGYFALEMLLWGVKLGRAEKLVDASNVLVASEAES